MHLGHRQPVAGHADEAHEPLLARLDRRLQRAVGAERDLPLDHVDEVVQLDRVDVVDAEAVERAADLLARPAVGPLAGLRGDEELALVPAQPGGDAQLGVAVGRRDVDVVDAVLEQQLQRAVGVGLGDAPQRRGAEDRAGRLVPGRPEGGAFDHGRETTPGGAAPRSGAPSGRARGRSPRGRSRRRGRRRRSPARARARGPRSSAAISSRPRMPWWRTRSTGNPSARTARSARSMRASVSGSTAVPYGIREARQGWRASPRSAAPAAGRARARPALPTPASSSGWRTPCSAAARRPGRQSPGVVGVGAREQHAVAAAPRELGERVVELGLAEVAAIRPVAAVALARELVGGDRLVRDPDRGGHAARAVELAGGDGGGDGGHRQRARPERAGGDGGHERGVDAARERDDGAPVARDAGLELGQQRRGHAPSACAAASACAHTVFTGAPLMPRGALAVGVLGREVDHLPVEPADLDAHRLAGRPRPCGSRARARCGPGARCARRACSSRAAWRSRRPARRRAARARTARSPGARASSARARSRRRARRRRSRPPPRRARARAAGRRGSPRSARPAGRRRPVSAPTIARTTLGSSAPSRVPAP